MYGAETWVSRCYCRTDAEIHGRISGKTGGLAVRWQRCVELKTFLLGEMVWTCQKGRGGVLGEVGEVRVGG